MQPYYHIDRQNQGKKGAGERTIRSSYPPNEALTKTGDTALWTNGFSIGAGGKLDLTDSSLAVEYSGASPLANIRAWVVAGFNGGGWNGNGICSSQGDTKDYGLGYAESSLVLGVGGGTFKGQAVDGTAVLVRYAMYGDSNLSGLVDIVDLGAIGTRWQGAGNWSDGDFNYDGIVDIIDLGMVGSHWQTGLPQGQGMTFEQALALFGQFERVAVPEPGLLCAGAVVLMLLCRRSVP